ncbi:Uncharacterised protein [[Haemophilus] ducreyi]|nr:Uncharacterised protein [[Haemophilus] ducreyi]
MKKDVTIYKNAPLPFIGQKRQFLTHYTEILNQYIPGDVKVGQLLMHLVVQDYLVM